MTELFSDAWMKQLKDAWNAEPEVCEKLAEIDFDSVICIGFKGEDSPRGTFIVEDGECLRAGAWSDTDPAANWDMRASRKDWLKWLDEGIGTVALGTAFATGKLKFEAGDYKAILKDPRIGGPFMKTFALMRRLDTDELA